MGWRGTVRSVAAVSRAVARDAERRKKEQARAQITSAGADAVWEWQQMLDDLTSIHQARRASIDWNAIVNRPEPRPPVATHQREDSAQIALDAFKPGKFDFLRGGSSKRQQQLIDAVATAQAEDEQAFRTAEAAFKTSWAQWNAETDRARRVLMGEASAIRQILTQTQSFSEVKWLGTQISFLIDDHDVHAVIQVYGDDIIPTIRRKQLASGRLSETKMPAGEFNELYQDYVCSVALRIAGEIFSLLPLSEVYVTCTPLMLDRSSGHQRHTPILSIHVVRSTFDRLLLSGIDPSDALKNFNHIMDFKRAKGFAEIVPLRPIE